jgi:hypothetical protein
MADTDLLRDEDAMAPSPRRVRWPIVIAAILGVALIAAAGAWWYLNSRAQIPDWERTSQLEFVLPAGDGLQNGTPWVRLQVSPLRQGADNQLRVALDTSRATPSAAATEPAISAVNVAPIGGGAAPEQLSLQPDETGALAATTRLDQPGWWRLAVEVTGESQPAELYLLVPDPNINGPNSVPQSPSSPEGEALYQRGSAATSALQSVSFTQWIADGNGNAGVSDRSVVAPIGDQPSGLVYRAGDGTQIVVIGSTRWVRTRGEATWQQQEGAAIVPPSEWAEEYQGATEFTILGEESVAGRPANLVAFVVPEKTEPRRQTVAWYLWWVDSETGHVLKEAMVSRVHYMLNEFGNFDEPLRLVPPEQPATPARSGTPIA